MLCPTCETKPRKFGKDRDGNQRWQCVGCRKTFSDRPTKLLGSMRLEADKAIQCLQLLVEGMSVRATMRVTGVNRNTILDLLALTGERCEKLLDNRLKGSGFMVRLPESHRTPLDLLKKKHRRATTVEVQIALEKHYKDESLPPPT